MKTIFKYTLHMFSEQTIDMPKGAQLLTAQMQNGVPCVWALVDTNADDAKRTIFIHGTGHEIIHDHPWVATFQDRAFVWHVFDGGEK